MNPYVRLVLVQPEGIAHIDTACDALICPLFNKTKKRISDI